MNRLQINESLIPKGVGKEVKHVQKVGGYWKVNRQFPFIHFEEERLYLFTEDGIFVLESD